MSNLVKQLVVFFNIQNPGEIEQFIKFLHVLGPTLLSNASRFLNILPNNFEELNAITAFKALLNLLYINSSSVELGAFYKEYSTKGEIEVSLNEVITDTLYDEARFRFKAAASTESDKELFKCFSQYDKLCEILYDLLNGVTDSMLSLYEAPSNRLEDRRMNFIREIIPILTHHGQGIKKIYSSEYEDTGIWHFINSVQQDLEKIYHNNELRFKKFFTDDEYKRVIKMSPDNLQVYLANVAASDINMREAKNLIKIKREIENYQKSLLYFRENLNINRNVISS